MIEQRERERERERKRERREFTKMEKKKSLY